MSDAKALIRRSAGRAAERYADSMALRAGVTLIPIVGGSIDALITTLAGRAQATRIEALIDALNEEARALRDDMVSKSFLDSEEWLDAVLASFEAAAKTRDRDQIRTYARILISATVPESYALPEPRALLSVLSELNPVELTLARLIADMPGSIRYDEQQQARREVTTDAWEKVLELAPPASKRNFLFHLKRLERAGLISELTGAFGGSGGRYEPTPTLMHIVGYLRAEANNSPSHGTT